MFPETENYAGWKVPIHSKPLHVIIEKFHVNVLSKIDFGVNKCHICFSNLSYQEYSLPENNTIHL